MNYLKTLILIFLIVLLSACSQNYDGMSPSDDHQEQDSVNLNEGSSPVRKIIYKAELTFYTSNLEEAIVETKALLQNDEWADIESISERSAQFTFRVKTERLDDILKQLNEQYKVTQVNKTATDISLNYQDKSDRIVALEIQRTRLLELYDVASFSDMILIAEQMSNIEAEIMKLEGELNQFDSLVDYSELRVFIYVSVTAEQLGFFQRVFHAFENGVLAVVSILDGLVIAIATVIPIAIVFVPAGYLVYRLIRYFDNRKKPKEPK
jgi:hypothetical protein